MKQEPIVKCLAFLCELRGVLKGEEIYKDLVSELDSLIKILEHELLKARSSNDDDHTLRKIVSEIKEWLKILFIMNGN